VAASPRSRRRARDRDGAIFLGDPRLWKDGGVRVLLVAIAILLATRAAASPARPRERAAVAAIDLGPGTPAYLRDTAASQIAAGLAAAGYEVVPAADVAARLTGELASCREGACVREVGEALGVRSVVFVAIEGKDDNTTIAMRLHDGSTGEREAEVADVCDLCGEAELGERLGVIASTLRARSLEARERKAKQAPAAPPPRPPPPAPVRAGPRSLVPGIASGAGGAAVLAAGVYLIAIDGRGACDRGDEPVYPAPGAVIRYPDPSNHDIFVCRDVYRTQAVGIVTAGLGMAALAAGVLLIVRAHNGGPTVEVAPRAGGAAVRATWSW
jgi:hypothetical protein